MLAAPFVLHHPANLCVCGCLCPAPCLPRSEGCAAGSSSPATPSSTPSVAPFWQFTPIEVPTDPEDKAAVLGKWDLTKVAWQKGLGKPRDVTWCAERSAGSHVAACG